VADLSAPQRGKRARIIKRRTYVECFQESDLPPSKGSCALGPVFLSASGLEEGIGGCAGIHLASLNSSELRLALAQDRTVCTVLFKKMPVFHM
jgi:hypothetical protein